LPAENPVLNQTPQSDFRNKVILTICLVLALGLSLFAVRYRWNNGVDIQNQAVRRMFYVVGEYLKVHDGRWPENWEALEQFPAQGEWDHPPDYELIRKNVIIDFDPDMDEIARQSPAEFQAIRPVNPVFDFGKDPRLVDLLNTVQKTRTAGDPTGGTPAE